MQNDLALLPGGFVMPRHEGRDLVARIASDGGWEAFERPMPRLFYDAAERNPGLIIDIGCNTGFYAMLACAASSANNVLAFEPDPNVRTLLLSNIALNRLGSRVAVSPLALSNESGQRSLYIPDQGHGLIESSSSLEASFKEAHSAVIPVQTARLDEVVPNNQPVTIIKNDIEGHELHALHGASGTIEKWRPLVFVEILERAEVAGIDNFFRVRRYVDIPLHLDRPLAIEETVAFHMFAWNHVFAPTERAEAFLTASRK